MSKSALTNFCKMARASVMKHSPEILTGIGIAGMITTTILAVKATPKATMIIEERKEELEINKLPVVDTVKATWKCYIPAAVTCALSVSCLICASKTNLKPGISRWRLLRL